MWIQGTLCFSGKAQSCSKILNGKKYIQYSEKFQGKLCFSGQAHIAKNPERWKNMQYTVYIQLEVMGQIVIVKAKFFRPLPLKCFPVRWWP